ncbi:MAM and LDL-receptor class A domain-containing protein 1-like [Anneissia japonica]|uniref:MAM and LDL-receptor class A domain-containing protein 1-like n=1 Tax=Anneissia japonica TaxID=1529436 RepID=UPI0014259B9A|nr:MAM and LDL-receptor class A domain-containing protein 1-like [Anneissia japonica]
MFLCHSVAALVFVVLCYCEVTTSQQHNLNCQFESDLCGFRNDENDDLNWIRRSQSFGNFLSLSSTHQSLEQTGRIFSPIMAEFSTAKCLEFYYSTNDTTATLNVYITKANELHYDNMIWWTNSSSGNHWRHILVDLTSINQAYKVLFEGKIRASSNVWIKLGNIALLNNVCFDNFLCDFEDSFCMVQSNNDNGDWQRNSGTTSSGWTGPTNDHTLGTSQGHYVYLEGIYGHYHYSFWFWGHSYFHRTNNDYTVRMETPTIRSSSEVHDRCLVFWYHMYGNHIETLNVYLLPNGEPNESEVFTKSGNGFNVWKTAHVTITETRNFKIIIEGTSTGYQGDVAIDDISILFQKCVIGFQCDFDHDICVEQDTTNDDKNWSIGRFIESPIQWLRDHTSGLGKYAFRSADNFRLHETATIFSKLLTSETGDKLCLKFWYCVKGKDAGQIFVFLVNSENEPMSLIWSEHTTDRFDVWRVAEVYFTPYDNYKISFEAHGRDGSDGVLAIDDIEINNGPCTIQDEFNCTFEDGFYLEKTGNSDTYEWSLHNRFVTSTGPFYDHTIGDEQGYYAFIDTNEQNGVNDTAIMLTPLIHNIGEDETKCLIFWYHMYGIHIQSLEVYVLSLAESLPGKLVWSKSGNRGNIWRAAEVEIKGRSNFQVVFRSERGDGIDGDIGVDDIIIKNGSCINTDTKDVVNVTCQFEEPNLCGYTHLEDNAFNWTWTNSALGSKVEAPGVPEVDHTTSSGLGFYVLADFRQSKLLREVARLQSPVNNETSLQCLELWHFIHGTNTQEFRVLLNLTSTIEKLLSIKGNRGPFWQKTTKEISPTDKYSIIFEVLSGAWPIGVVAIDDVKVTRGNCEIVPTSTAPEPVTVLEVDCGFESNDLCGYIQDVNDDFDWSLKTVAELEEFYKSLGQTGVGHEWYPPTDKSILHSNTGTFLFADLYQYSSKHGKARILSPLIKKTESQTCLKFWFYKQGFESAFLNVYMLKHNDLFHGDPLLALYGSYGNQWILQQVDIPLSSKPFQIIFESVKGKTYHSSDFIDEIDYERSPCPNDIVCDFEDGFGACQISNEDRTLSKFQWKLSRGFTATEGTGPTADHTYGNGTGMYVYIETSQPQHPGDRASLSTIYWKKIQRDACLKFWYYCDSIFSGNFIVYHRRLDAKELLWQMPRVFEKTWSEVRIQLSPAKESYQIVFTGEVGKSFFGDIALDDIVLSSSPCTVSSNTPPIDGIASKLKVLQNYDCNLEQGKCKIAQLASDQFDWTFSVFKIDMIKYLWHIHLELMEGEANELNPFEYISVDEKVHPDPDIDEDDHKEIDFD